MPELSLEQFFLVDAPARVRAFVDEATLHVIGTADSMPDAMESASDVPALHGIHGRMPNLPVNGHRRLVAGHRKKLYKFMPVFSLTTDSFASNFKEDSRAGGWVLAQVLANIFDGWLAPGMIRPFDVVDLAFVMRSPDLTRVQHQIVLEGVTEMFTTPALVAP